MGPARPFKPIREALTQDGLKLPYENYGQQLTLGYLRQSDDSDAFEDKV